MQRQRIYSLQRIDLWVTIIVWFINLFKLRKEICLFSDYLLYNLIVSDDYLFLIITY